MGTYNKKAMALSLLAGTAQSTAGSAIPGGDMMSKFQAFSTQIAGVGSSLNNVSGVITEAQATIKSDVKGMVDEGVQKAVQQSTEAAKAAADSAISNNPIINEISAKYGYGESVSTNEDPTTNNGAANDPGEMEGGGRSGCRCCCKCNKKRTRRKKHAKRRKTRVRRR